MDHDRKYPFLFFLVVAAAFASALLFGLLVDEGRPGPPAGSEPPVSSRGSRPNVVLITIDTLRHDHLGCTGHDAVQTPNIDRLASEGVLFEQALSSAPTTLPSHASIFTGALPFVHGVRNNGNFKLAGGEITLAEILREHGYKTAAFVGSYVLDSQFGLDQGFDTYDDDMAGGSGGRMFFYDERPAGLVTEAALKWLRKHGGENIFMWLHYFDPHVPYDPPPPYDTKYTGSPYDGEIAYADGQVGILLKALEEMGLYDNSILVLTSDHGESLGEHGELTHGVFIYDSTLRVPLILRFPRLLPESKRVSELVQLIDIMPTLLEILEIPLGMEDRGQSLVSLIQGRGEAGSRGAYCETFFPFYYYGWSELSGIRTEQWKYIRAPKPELYDLKADPLETSNLFDLEPGVVENLAAMLEAMTPEREEAAGKPLGETDVSAETLEKLRRLGYFIGAPGFHALPDQGERPDPKDRILMARDLDQAADLFVAGRYAEAAELYDRILEGNPGNLLARLYLAFACLKMGNMDRAMEAYKTALDVSGDDSSVMTAMAAVLLDTGHADASIKEYERAAGLFPEDGRILNSLGAACLAAGRVEEAISAFQKAKSADPALADACYNLGTAYILTARLDEAAGELKEALALSPEDPDILNNLGVVYSGKGMWKEAVEAYEKALILDPDNLDAHYNLGLIHAGPVKNRPKALFHFNRVIEIDPGHPRAADAGQALAGPGD